MPVWWLEDSCEESGCMVDSRTEIQAIRDLCENLDIPCDL
jgi:hypothetical protein